MRALLACAARLADTAFPQRCSVAPKDIEETVDWFLILY